MPEGQVLEFSRLTKRFGSVHAVSDLTARVEPGAVTGFLGPNGAGKTTTLRMLLGLVRPSSGTATIGGAPYARLKKPLQTVGAVLEASSFHPGRTGANHLKIYAQAAGLSGSRIDETLGLVGLADAAGRKVGGYSLGMRQRLGLAYALLGDPGVLVLDEPANGLDPEGIKWLRGFLQQLAREGRTVLVSSHLLAEVQQTADAVLILADGRRVFNGSISDLVDPAEQVTIVDSGDRAGLVAALRDAGIASEVLRSGVTVRSADPAEVGRAAAAAGIPLTALQRRGPALEEVFLELVSGVRVHPSADAAYDDRVTSMDAGAPGVGVPGVAAISAAETTAAATSPAEAGAAEAAGAEAAGGETAGGEAGGEETSAAETSAAETGAVQTEAPDASATEADAPEATRGSRTAVPVIAGGVLVAPAVVAAAETPDEDTEFDAPAPAEDAGEVREAPRPAFAVAGTGVIDIVPTLPSAAEQPDHTEADDTEADDTAADDTADTTRDTSDHGTGDDGTGDDGDSGAEETAAQQAAAPPDSTEARAAEPGDKAVDEPGDELDAGTAHFNERDDSREESDQALDDEDFADGGLTDDVESAYVTHSAHAGEDERTESDLAADAFFSSFDHRASGGENATAGDSTDDELAGGDANAESDDDEAKDDAKDDSTDAQPASDSPTEPEAEHPDEQHPDEQHPNEQHPDESPGAQPDEARHDEEGAER